MRGYKLAGSDGADSIDRRRVTEKDLSSFRQIGDGRIKWYLSFALGALFGAVVFIMLYGVRILDVTYDDWLLTGWYDLSQHYVGWKLYRASGWHFPIGLCDTSFYPYLASVIYTDSVPLVCLFFKILSPVLPETFQFFGLYGLFCFMMQGGLAKLILRRLFPNEAICCVACIPFVFCAPLWQRMFYHTALASQYLILLAILLFMYRDRIDKQWKRIALWCGLGVLCIMIHFTIYGIVSILLLGFALWEAMDHMQAGPVGVIREESDGNAGQAGTVHRISGAVIVFLGYLAAYLASTVFVFYLFGGFYGNISGEAEGLGVFSANLNSLVNPIDYSRIIREFPLTGGQYEGLSYIGVAAVIMLFPALLNIIKNYREIWRGHRNAIIVFFTVSLILWVIALSPVVTAGSKVLCEIPLPGFIYDVWSMFRASGRFLWPVMYAVILISMYFAGKETGRYFTVLLLIACLLQLYEFSGKAESINAEYEEVKEAHFQADRLDMIDWEGIEHLQFMHDYYFGEFYGDEIRGQMIGYTEFALRHGMTVSNFHFSRDDMDGVRGYIADCMAALEAGRAREDTMYVFRRQDFDPDYLQSRFKNVRYIQTDEDIIVVADTAD